jgi:hypothetical protein
MYNVAVAWNLQGLFSLLFDGSNVWITGASKVKFGKEACRKKTYLQILHKILLRFSDRHWVRTDSWV